MTYSATVINVMIASPSDVAQERQIIRDVIHEWNAIHSSDRSLVLLPVGWDTHASPEMGGRPQEIINGQILKSSDLVIAVFWTKFGSPTGKALSGTEEEINEHVDAGKPVLLYFSSEPAHPDSIDPDQYKALKEFERASMAKGLVQKYETKSEFRTLLTRQLAQTVMRKFEHVALQEAVNIAILPKPEPTLSDGLSSEGRELLVEASKDNQGVVMRLSTLGGYHVQTNRREFIEGGDTRAAAKWRSAVDELEKSNLIEDRTGKGEVFFITNLGYEVADQLGRGE